MGPSRCAALEHGLGKSSTLLSAMQLSEAGEVLFKQLPVQRYTLRFTDMWNTGYICCPDPDPPRYTGITDDMQHRSWSCRRMGRRVCRWTFRMVLGARFHSRCFRRSLRKSGSSLGLEKNRMVLTTTEALSMEVNSGIRHCHGTDNSLPTGFLSLAAPDTRATQSPGCVCLRF
jgi:hypothetical protein